MRVVNKQIDWRCKFMVENESKRERPGGRPRVGKMLGPRGQKTRITIPNSVRLVREARKWSLEELAVRADCSAGHLSRVEAGQREPGVLLALRIAIALDRTVQQLWPVASPGTPELTPDLFKNM